MKKSKINKLLIATFMYLGLFFKYVSTNQCFNKRQN